MNRIHDVFPLHPAPKQDPISHKKLCKQDGLWALNKDLLSFTFNRQKAEKTMQLEHPKQEFLLVILLKWLRASSRAHIEIPFMEFELSPKSFTMHS